MLVEYNNTKNPLEEAADYVKAHPNLVVPDNVDVPPNEMGALDSNSGNFRALKYKGSSFRHKGDNRGLIRDFGRKKSENVVKMVFFF